MSAEKLSQLVAPAKSPENPSADPAMCAPACASTPNDQPPAGIERVNRGLFAPGKSANPGGKPKGERVLLQRMYGQNGRKVFKRLEALRNDAKTPKRLQAQIDFFIIERLFGKAPQMVGVEGGPSLLSLLAEVTARSVAAAGDGER